MDSKKVINICFACDDKYAPYAGVSIASFLKNSNNDEFFNFYILENKISEKNKIKINTLKKIKDCNIIFKEVDDTKFDNFYLPEKKGYLSITAYYRFEISKLFQNTNRMLYVDCDVIATSSIWEFYNINLDNKCAAVVRDTACEENQKRLNFNQDEIYFNSGVILINLEQWRNEKISDKLFSSAHEKLDDQDILNIVLKGKTILVNDKWNYQGKAKYYKEKTYPNLIHFITAYKPCVTGSKKGFNNEYFKALAITPWNNFYDQHIRRFLPIIHKDKKYIHLCFFGLKTRLLNYK